MGYRKTIYNVLGGFYGYYSIMIVRISVHKVHKNCMLFLCDFTYFFVVLCAVNECIKTTTLIPYYTSIFSMRFVCLSGNLIALI